jgi:glycosyltransferase involved in cell wall biosynthesis
MRIALDATPLTLSSGGQRRHVEDLACALAREFTEDRIWLASGENFQAPDGLPVLPHGNSWIDRKWWLFGASRALRRNAIDVFHGTNFEVPYLRTCPSVLSLLDLSPWMDPAWHTGAGRVRSRTPWLIRSNRAQLVVTSTEAVRRQAIEHFRLAEDRVIAVPLAANALFRPVPVVAASPYFLFVGTLEPRKNIGMLVEAWRELRKSASVELVIAGRCRADFTLPPAEPGLRLLGEVPDVALAGLYSGALACVYPSHYEGFGLPVIEAMQCGAVVITSTDASVEEVGGAAALRASNVQELVETMRAVLQNPELVRVRREQSLERARQFSWSRTARLTREVYAEAIRRFH